jgi:hypothetical protein
MGELQGNIVEFNLYVRGVLNDCSSYGVNANETLANVMWAYSKVDDKKFIWFAEH